MDLGVILIVGGGPAGLGVAYSLEHDYLILEKEETTGGLCRSFQVGGCTFDYGGHAFFTRHPEIRQLISELAAQPLYEQPRSAWVYSHGMFLPYPFQSNLFGLPVDVVRDCLLGTAKSWATASAQPPANLDEWIYRQFGDGIAKHFMVPYNRKLWAFPLDSIAATWTGDRIVQPDLADIIEGALSRREYRNFPNSCVAYPAQGGFAELFRPLAERAAAAGRVKHAEVSRVDLRNHRVITADGAEYHYDQLVATLPLPELAAITDGLPTEIRALAGTLRYNSLHLVSLAVSSHNANSMQRLYVADPDVAFHKLVMNNNSSPSLRSAPHYGIQAEVSFSAHKRVDPDAVESAVIDSLVRIGVIRSESDVQARDVRQVKYAYPVATHGSAEAVDRIRAWYAADSVWLSGRFAEWKYFNSDSVLHDAIALGRRLRAGGPV